MASPAPINGAGDGSTTGGGERGLPGAPFPPRPKAIATFLSSSDFMRGCQTLLHSLKAHLPPTPPGQYPPEIVVLLSSKVGDAAATADRLRPIFCDRVARVEHIPVAATDPDEDGGGGGGKPGHVRSWDENCGWTKLRLFALQEYDAILYIDADCLVVKDVGHLLDIGDLADEAADEANAEGGDRAKPPRRRGKAVGLLAAAPDIFPPDKFNAGVMVLRPSRSVFEEMMSRLPGADPSRGASSACESYDGGDTGFLNAFYPGWYSSMPRHARLPFGYNAQRFMHHCTYEKQPRYWDDAIDDVRIIHFSSSPKPWEKDVGETSGETKDRQSYLDDQDASGIQTVAKSGKLERMWQAAYEKSQKYYVSELKKRSTKQKNAAQRRAAPSTPARPARTKQKNTHQMVHGRYKELRKAGMGTKEAMKAARAEYGLDKDETDPGRSVGQMFGLM